MKSDVQQWLFELPKVSLHCHLEGTLQPATFRAMALRAGGDLAQKLPERDDELYAFATFHDFLMRFRDVCAVLRKPEDYAQLAHEYAVDAMRQGILAAEIFVSPSAWLRLHPELDVRAAFEAIRAALQQHEEQSGLHVSILCDLTRNFGAEAALRTAEIAISMRDLGVIGVGLGGDEVHFPAELFRDAFRLAQRADLHCVAHAGEVAGPESVRAAVEVLGAERIGHGVRAIEDAAVVEMLARRTIALEQAPTSNRHTGAVVGVHPMARFVAAGVRVAIDADDPALFGSSLLDELALVAEMEVAAFVVDRARDAVSASFLPDDRKRVLLDELGVFAQKPFPEFVTTSTNADAS